MLGMLTQSSHKNIDAATEIHTDDVCISVRGETAQRDTLISLPLVLGLRLARIPHERPHCRLVWCQLPHFQYWCRQGCDGTHQRRRLQLSPTAVEEGPRWEGRFRPTPSCRDVHLSTACGSKAVRQLLSWLLPFLSASVAFIGRVFRSRCTGW